MNFKTIRYILSWVLKIEAISMILPLICAFCYREDDLIRVWFLCIAICLFTGLIISFRAPKDKNMFAKDGFVCVAFSWIAISLFGALPFVLSGTIPDYVDALFETVSGFTTTGASILGDVETLPRSILFWRSFTHWIGGMGVLVFLVALLPLTGSSNFFLIKAESPGPSVSKLVPKVKSTATILYSIYIGITALQIVLLLAGGLDLFEASTLTFGTVGTGGFAVKNSGIADYSSYTQIVITVFMIICGVDFGIYHLLIMRKFRTILKSDELKGYIFVILFSILTITINCYPLYDTFGSAVKHSAFQVGSLITTTGYSTADYNAWPELSKTVLVMLMFFGACAGSTGGGIKISRVMILLKSIVKEIKIMAHPKSTVKIKMNGRVVEHETVRGINVFLMAYLAIYLVSMLIISIDNFDFTTNFTAVSATINNIGPGLGGVGPTSNFSGYSTLSTLVFIFDMLAGRLEIFPLLLLLSPYTWKK